MLILSSVSPGLSDIQQTCCSFFQQEPLEKPYAICHFRFYSAGMMHHPLICYTVLLQKLPNDQGKWLHSKKLHNSISLLNHYEIPFI